MIKNHSKLHLIRAKTAGQNVIEYLLVTAVFLLICVVFFHPAAGPAKTAMENILNQTIVDINKLRDEIVF
jgi:hypothetical protein